MGCQLLGGSDSQRHPEGTACSVSKPLRFGNHIITEEARDETLADHRPAWLFAQGTSGPDGKAVCSVDLFGTESVAATGFPSGNPLCAAINRPHVPTFYPSTAEIYFLAVRAAVPDAVGYLLVQLAGLLIGGAVTLMLLRVLARTGLPVRLAAAWAWSPFVELASGPRITLRDATYTLSTRSDGVTVNSILCSWPRVRDTAP